MVVFTCQCAINVVKTISTTKSIIITLHNEDVKCQYRIYVRERHKDSTDCHQAQQRVECNIENLDPGTWYYLDIISKVDEQQHMRQNVSLPTSKKSAFHLKIYFTFWTTVYRGIIESQHNYKMSCMSWRSSSPKKTSRCIWLSAEPSMKI